VSKKKTSISLEKTTLKRIDKIAASMKPPVSRSALIDHWLMDRFLRESGTPRPVSKNGEVVPA
jgi:metal-responsive CopG/Arc/MetJ family transcriptional regulator